MEEPGEGVRPLQIWAWEPTRLGLLVVLQLGQTLAQPLPVRGRTVTPITGPTSAPETTIETVVPSLHVGLFMRPLHSLCDGRVAVSVSRVHRARFRRDVTNQSARCSR